MDPGAVICGAHSGQQRTPGWLGFLSPQTAGEGCRLSVMIQTPHQENQARSQHL